MFNEPAFFTYRTDYSKKEIKSIAGLWTNAIKSDKLVTYSLYGDNDMFQWDPAILDCDFISFHEYPHLSKDYGYSYKMAVLRTKINYRWFKENINKPWIIGETGFPGTNYIKKNLFIGTEQQQINFVHYTNNAINYAGGKGLIYWQYSEVHWFGFDAGAKARNNCYGIKYSFVNEVPDSVKNSWKPAVNELLKFSLEKESNSIDLTDEEYYNFFHYQYSPVTGIVVDENNVPVKGAIIFGHWMYYDESHKKHKFHNKTFSKNDGTFTLYLKSLKYKGKLIKIEATYLNKLNYIKTDSFNDSRFYKIELKGVD